MTGVDLFVSQGEVVGLLGPNGAGKTTTFYMIVGLVPVDKGNIILDNEIITELTIDQRAQIGIAYLPQEASIFRELTVEDNILSVLELKRLNKDQQMLRCNELIKEFNIEKIRHSFGRELSGGERRRSPGLPVVLQYRRSDPGRTYSHPAHPENAGYRRDPGG